MRLLLLFSLVAIAFAANSGYSNIHSHTTDNLRSAALKLQALHDGNPTIAQPHHLEAINATACLEAWIQLSEVLNSSCGQIAVLYGPNVTNYNVTDLVLNQCEVKDVNGVTCQTKINAAIVKFSDFCSGPGLQGIDGATRASLELWLTMSKLPCIKDGMDYCYPIFNANLQSFQVALNNGAQVDAGLLDTVCIPCVTKVINQLAVWGIKEFVAASAQLKIACTKKNGEYCFPTFIAATKTNGMDSPDEVDVVCDECTRTIAFRLWLANVLLGSMGNQTQIAELQLFLQLQAFFCQKNNKNQYCMNVLQAYDTSLIGPSCAGVLLGIQQCAAGSCGTEITKFKNSVGCCFGTWFDYMQFFYLYNQTGYNDTFHGIPPVAIRALVEGACGVEIPLSCATQKLLVKWAVTNILKEWYDAHKDWFEDQFKQLVAYVLAISDTQVTITSVYDATNKRVFVTVHITGQCNLDVTYYAQYLANPLQVEDDTNSVVVVIKDTDSAQGISQTAAIKDPITISAQSIDVCTGDCNWASLTTPSFSLFALLALLLAYFN